MGQTEEGVSCERMYGPIPDRTIGHLYDISISSVIGLQISCNPNLVTRFSMYFYIARNLKHPRDIP